MYQSKQKITESTKLTKNVHGYEYFDFCLLYCNSDTWFDSYLNRCVLKYMYSTMEALFLSN